MLFKNLKVGDTIYVKNPKQWNKPIKKTIGNIVPDGLWILFYTPEGEFIGDAIACRPLGNRSGIFADFDAFKQYWIDYQKKNVEQLQEDMTKVAESLENACLDLETANLMEDED